MTQTSLAHYRILGKLGAGGMGEVYRAEDTKLKREVAIKVLPETFAQDAERMKRFEREAQVLASLNHPNIAAIYGLEESDGERFLVLELAEGEDLAERLSRGAIPVDEALQIAKQMTEGLEQAHEKRIIHRDLKPAKVKVSRDGFVKILDFGLAKALAGDIQEISSRNSQSPTLARPATVAGVILGTPAYMSPEQARGKTADRRADIWAFGAVLYEMLTGRRPFEDETEEPDFDPLPDATPLSIRRLLRRCLECDPKRRLQAIGEARIQPEDVPQGASDEVPSRPAWFPWALAAMGIALASLALWAPWRRPALPAPLVRASIELGADVELGASSSPAIPAMAFSPDGALLAFVGNEDDGESSRIYLRRFDQLQASPLSGTEGAQSLFFSPDGESIGFFASGKLKRIPLTGGPAVALADVSDPRGGSWSDDRTLIFTAINAANVGLTRMPSTGGALEALTKPDRAPGENFHRWPQALPGGKAVLFTASRETNCDNASLVVQLVADGQRKFVVRGGYHGRYLPSGHLVYVRESTLFAVPFDLARLETTGAAVPVVEGVVSDATTGGAQFAFSSSGALVYKPGGDSAGSMPIHWLDGQGKQSPLREPGDSRNLRISPDGKKLAIEGDEESGFHVGPATAFLNSPFNESHAAFSPDGRWLAYSSNESGSYEVYVRPYPGAGGKWQISTGGGVWPAWSRNGRELFYETLNQRLMVTPYVVRGDSFDAEKPRVSSETRIAYQGERIRSFHLHPDGERFAIVAPAEGSAEGKGDYVVLVQNFFDELRRLAPPSKR